MGFNKIFSCILHYYGIVTKLHKTVTVTYNILSQHHFQNLMAFTDSSARNAAIMNQGNLAKEIYARVPIESRQKPEVTRCGRKSGDVEIKEIFHCGEEATLRICRT